MSQFSPELYCFVFIVADNIQKQYPEQKAKKGKGCTTLT